MTERQIPFYIADVFGIKKYSGNQLAIFPDAKEIAESEMQQIAREINFSETTFITSTDIAKKTFDVRIFTPNNEVPFAGHPTLGTAFILFKDYLKPEDNELILNVKAGKIHVTRKGEIVWMQQIQPEFGPQFNNITLARILNLNENDIDTNFPVQQVSTGLPFIITPLKSIKALKQAKVKKDLARELLADSKVKELMVFATEGYSNTDTISSRVFVEEFGIPEDPATGSATGCLAAYLLKYNILSSDKIETSVAQGYEIGRPSRLYIKASFTNNSYQINIGGQVNIISKGMWF